MTDYEVTPPPDRLADRVQLRTAFSTDKGEVAQFMVQLEYWLDGDWQEVIQYSHDRDGSHNVTEDGLHMDVFQDGMKVCTEIVSLPLPANEGFTAASQLFTKRAK